MATKVLVISNYRSYHGTRPEAYIFIGLAKLGFDISIMTYGDADMVKEFEAAGIKVIDFHPEKKNDKTAISLIRKTLIDEKIDILHLFNNRAIVNGIQAAKGVDVRVVLYRGYCGNIHWYDPTAYFKFLHPRVDKIVCNAKGVEKMFHRQLFFDKSKTITINKGHDVNWYKANNPIDIKNELGIPEDSFLLINVANNRRMKGIPYLLKAMCQLKEKKKIHLLIAGKGMETSQNLRIIEKCGIKSNVHLLGFRPDPLNLVAACDVFVLSSIKGESIPKAVIEAMSLEKAPIISDIPGNYELAVHGKSGLVFRSKDLKGLVTCILKLYDDRNLAKEMGKEARVHIERELNIETTITRMKELYEDLVNN